MFLARIFVGRIRFGALADILAEWKVWLKVSVAARVTTDLNCGPTKSRNNKLNSHDGIGYLITENSLSSTLRNLRTVSCEQTKDLPIVSWEVGVPAEAVYIFMLFYRLWLLCRQPIQHLGGE